MCDDDLADDWPIYFVAQSCQLSNCIQPLAVAELTAHLVVNLFTVISSLSLSLSLSQDVTDSRHPVWPQVFYCMRCGDLEASLKVLNEAKLVNHTCTHTLTHTVV